VKIDNEARRTSARGKLSVSKKKSPLRPGGGRRRQELGDALKGTMMLNMKTEFGERYTVRWDEAKKAGGWSGEDYYWLMQIRGPSGFISLHNENSLCVVAIGKAKSRELAKMAGIDLKVPRSKQTPRAGWRLLQFGDWELRCALPTEEIDAVARLIGAMQRKPMTPEEHARQVASGKELAMARKRASA
jgi:hypothetical protein